MLVGDLFIRLLLLVPLLPATPDVRRLRPRQLPP